MKTTRCITLRRQQVRSGFTLLELLIVLAIILVIAAMVVPNLIGQQQGAMEKTTRATINQMLGTVGTYAADHDGNYPDGSGKEVWQNMMQPETYKGTKIRPYFEEPPTDAWGNVLMYEWNAKDQSHSKKQGALKPAIWSMGADGQDDGGENDDINSWTPRTSDSGK